MASKRSDVFILCIFLPPPSLLLTSFGDITGKHRAARTKGRSRARGESLQYLCHVCCVRQMETSKLAEQQQQ